jgi:hypothetical protein
MRRRGSTDTRSAGDDKCLANIGRPRLEFDVDVEFDQRNHLFRFRQLERRLTYER